MKRIQRAQICKDSISDLGPLSNWLKARFIKLFNFQSTFDASLSKLVQNTFDRNFAQSIFFATLTVPHKATGDHKGSQRWFYVWTNALDGVKTWFSCEAIDGQML